MSAESLLFLYHTQPGWIVGTRGPAHSLGSKLSVLTQLATLLPHRDNGVGFKLQLACEEEQFLNQFPAKN